MPSPPRTARPPTWAVVVPVKPLARAKSRLGGSARELRADFALAMATDTAAAALACPRVVGVLAVTDDRRAADELAGLGAVVVGDVPDRGLNAALEHGAAEARARLPADGVAALSADLPALRPDELTLALDTCAAHARAFVADVSGTGTTLLTARGGTALNPLFGPRSRAAHRAGGAVEVSGAGVWTVRRDVDTEVDLYDALRLGTGPRTARVAAALGAEL